MVTGNEQDIENRGEEKERKSIRQTPQVLRKGFWEGSYREYFHSFFFGPLRTWEENRKKGNL